MSRAHPDPALRPIWPGTLGPSSGAPARTPGGMRRTTSLDITFDPADVLPHHAVLLAAGRDLRTPLLGEVDMVDPETVAHQRAEVTVEVLTGLTSSVHLPEAPNSVNGRGRAVNGGIGVEPEVEQPMKHRDAHLAEVTDHFVGISSGGRFRKAVAAHIDSTAAHGNLLSQLLDDVPIGMVIGGSSFGRRGLIPVGIDRPRRGPITDVCIGWRAGGEMQRAIDEGDIPYMGEGPIAGLLDSVDDPLAWHTMPPLDPGTVRRRRRIDVNPHPNGLTIDSMFRDSYVEPDGSETAIHEYELRIQTNLQLVVVSSVATPRVLPGPECPGAAQSVQRLIGHRISSIRELVTAEFTGTTICTHLNDLCRAVGLIGLLISEERRATDAAH